MNISVKGKSARILDFVTQYRRELHENPELSGEEIETSKRIQQQLSKFGIPYQTGFAKTGVLGIIKGGKPGRTVAIRADMDALPINENTNLPYASNIPGKMHACGHDVHHAMLLGAGILLNELKEEMEGTILLLFQPAEEDSPEGGAEQMMKDGVFAEYKPDVILAQHVWPDLPVGQFGILPGPMMGNSDKFKIVINGSGGHASMPHQTIDAIIVVNQVINALQTIVSRNVDPLASAVVTIGKIEGGCRHNVVADKVTLEGTVRTLSIDVKAHVKDRFYTIVEGVTKSMGAEVHIDYMDGYPATVNTPEVANQVKKTLENLYGPSSVPSVSPSLGGEDFGRFLLKYPGTYFWLGSSIGPDQKPLHDPRYVFNEDALPYGIEGITQAALDLLNTLKEAE